MATSDRIKAEVSRHYAEALTEGSSCCDGGCGCAASDSSGWYPLEELGQMPEGVQTFGSGHPVARADIQKGETVLDLGSGTGLDCFLAAQLVGPEGRVIGVDFTQDMVARSRQNAAELAVNHVTFVRGDMEALPQDDASVDVVVSNCVINLAPDKDAVFLEAFRVLRPGGRFVVSDIVRTRAATESESQDVSLIAGCVSGAIMPQEYAVRLRAAGFEDVRVEVEGSKTEESSSTSAIVFAAKP